MGTLNFHHIALLIILISLGTVIALKFICFSEADFTAEAFFESDKPLNNPYCGFYHIIGYTLSEDYTATDAPAREADSYTESLVLLEVNLKNYRSSEIGDRGLAQLNDILYAWSESKNGTKIIIRFLYDWDGAALVSEPDSLELVLKHMEQVSPAVNRYPGAVYIMQGVFIGNWGEMHHSKFADPDSVNILIHRLNELIDPHVYLSVRTPAFWRAASGLYAPPEQFRSSQADNPITARLGLFNDGILGSETDLGTYGNTERADAPSPYYHGTRKEELEFQNRLCRYVPNGGEVIYNNNLSGLKTAVAALRTMRISYLNADYDGRVLEEWKNSVWTGNDAFNGRDGYTYIKAHLGYRYFIVDCEMKKSGFVNTAYSLRLTLKNSGFTSTLADLEAFVTLVHKETGEEIRVPFGADLRTVDAGNKKTFTGRIPVKGLRQGEYLVYFSLTDKAANRPIFLGNDSEMTESGYLLGRLIK